MSKIAFISGANRGIGFHIASNVLALPDFGLVLLAGRSERAVREAVGLMEAAAAKDASYQGRVEFIPLDLSDAASVTNAVGITSKILGSRKIDVVINNAAFAFAPSCRIPFSEQATTTVRINYTNTKVLLEGLLPLMQPKTGRMVQLGSRIGCLSSIANPDARRMLEDVRW